MLQSMGSQRIGRGLVTKQQKQMQTNFIQLSQLHGKKMMHSGVINICILPVYYHLLGYDATDVDYFND